MCCVKFLYVTSLYQCMVYLRIKIERKTVKTTIHRHRQHWENYRQSIDTDNIGKITDNP